MIIHVSDSPMWRNIRYLRRKRKMSRRTLSQITTIPVFQILLWETRLSLEICSDDINCLCDTFGVDVSELIEYDLRRKIHGPLPRKRK